LPNIDPVLYDIFTSEVATHLGVMDAFVAGARAPNAPSPASEPLLRAVHTLNGAVAMVDVPVITHVLAPLENYIKRLCAENRAPEPAGVDALDQTSTLIRNVIAALDRGDANLPDSDELAQRICVLRDALPEPQLMHTLFSRGEEAEAPARVEESPDSAEAAPSEMAEAPTSPARVDAPVAPADSSWLESIEPAEAEGAAVRFAESANEPTIDVIAHEEVTDAASAPVGATPVEEAATAAEAASAPDGAHVSDHADEEPATVAHELAGAELLAIDIPLDADMARFESELAGAASSAPVEVPASMEAASPEPVSYADIPFATDLSQSLSEPPPAPMPDFAHVPVATLADVPLLADDAQPEGRLELAEMDEDLLEIFVQEGADILDHSDSLMASLRASPQDRELVGGLQRDLHTLKGGARMAGLAPIGDLSHAMESLLDAISENRRVMDRVTVESLERGFDRLHSLVQRVAKRQAIAMPVNAIARFEGLVSGELPPTPAEPVIQATETPVPVEPVSAPVSAEPAAPATAAPRPAPRPLPRFEEEEVTARAPQEMIRVRSDLLDSLVNYAGEVSIYRSRLEQQISTFRFNLVEFETTVSRLRDQLRKLELETEAQILSRFQREAEATESVFDPLELDRFSQLQQLSRALAESVSDLTSIQGLLDDLTRQSETLLLQQSRVSSDLQEGLMRTRMVPFESLVPSLRRTLRQAAQELSKRAQLKVEGAQGEMDRNLLERMKAPFEHMMRNALAHGIETPEERLVAGKPLDGTVGIQVSREATEVVLRVSDDGRGLDRDAIRRKAIERGLLKPDVQLSDRDLYGFILESGFSTVEQVTQLAGRGVGMDVVHQEIKQLGGSLAIDSTHGAGTTFVIRLPFTLAVTQAILVRLGEATYAVPMSSVQGVARIARKDLERRLADANPSYAYAGEEFLIYELSNLLNVAQGRIADVVAKDAQKFLTRLQKENSCFLLHLSISLKHISLSGANGGYR